MSAATRKTTTWRIHHPRHELGAYATEVSDDGEVDLATAAANLERAAPEARHNRVLAGASQLVEARHSRVLAWAWRLAVARHSKALS